MDFITAHWQLLFGGLGTAIVSALIGAWAKSYFDNRRKPPKNKLGVVQESKSGPGSSTIQAGRDVHL